MSHFGFFILILRDSCPSPVEESSHHRSFMFRVIMIMIMIPSESLVVCEVCFFLRFPTVYTIVCYIKKTVTKSLNYWRN